MAKARRLLVIIAIGAFGNATGPIPNQFPDLNYFATRGVHADLALSSFIGAGYALGRISVFGFSLGVGGVLFAGLALGAFAPGSVPPPMVGSIGLLLFLYGIGVQYGVQFFAGLRGAGQKHNLIAFVAVMGGLAVSSGRAGIAISRAGPAVVAGA